MVPFQANRLNVKTCLLKRLIQKKLYFNVYNTMSVDNEDQQNAQNTEQIAAAENVYNSCSICHRIFRTYRGLIQHRNACKRKQSKPGN